MSWKVEWDERAVKELEQLGSSLKSQVLRFLRERVASGEDSTWFGKPLRHDRWGLWRYRVGIVRIITSLENDRMVILVLRVGKREHVYGWHPSHYQLRCRGIIGVAKVFPSPARRAGEGRFLTFAVRSIVFPSRRAGKDVFSNFCDTSVSDLPLRLQAREDGGGDQGMFVLAG